MDELESQSVPDATAAAAEAAAGDNDANGPSSTVVAAAVTTATTMILASSSADVSTTRKPSGEFDVIVETPCESGSLPDSSCTAAPLSWRPAAAAGATSEAAGSRSLETTREVHHVTFAEPCNKYVHSDSGIVLSPDDSDVNDVNVDGQSTELTDDECDEVTGGQETDDGPVRCPAPTNAVPGPPIIKLHRCRSNESQDNPFLFDGELRRKADYIIAHSTILRTYVRIADPDQIPVDQQQQQSTSDTELHPVTVGDDATEPQASELAAGLTNGEGGQPVVSPESPSATPQKVASKELSAPVRNGEAEEPLLYRKKEENILESSPKKHTRSKKQICCVVQ